MASDTLKTKVEKMPRKRNGSDLEDAVHWLTEHVGFPATSRRELERRRRDRRAA